MNRAGRPGAPTGKPAIHRGSSVVKMRTDRGSILAATASFPRRDASGDRQDPLDPAVPKQGDRAASAPSILQIDQCRDFGEARTNVALDLRLQSPTPGCGRDRKRVV